MLTCHRPTLSLTVFAVGSIESYLCNFRQMAYIRLTIHKFTHLPSPTLSLTVSAVGSIESSLGKFKQIAYFRLTIHRYT